MCGVKEVPIPALQDAIRSLHGCESRFRESVPVVETFNGSVVWAGEVQVFDLVDHAKAKTCYAWTHAVDGSDTKRKFVVALHAGVVDSPLTAVRASIVQEAKC